MDIRNTDHEFVKGSEVTSRESAVRRVMLGVYGWMTLALLISAVTGLYLVSNINLLYRLYATSLYWVLAIGEVVLVIFLSARAHKMSPAAAKLAFVVYAVLNGVTFGAIFAVYDIGTVGYAFLVTAITFAVMSGYGYVTKTDLSSIGNLFVMGLFGLIIATVVNLFIPNDTFTTALMYIGVILFIGLIGYDTQRIKQYAYAEGHGVNNAAITGALILYLDFINIFIRLVSLMNRER